jgi:hypothetical protein
MKTRTMCFLLLCIALPGTLRAQAPATITVSVMDGTKPVLNAKVALILKSGAYQNAKLDGDVYTCEAPGPCAKVFAGAPGYEAATVKVGSGSGAITVNLKPSDTKNSTVIESSGELPGIEGRVNPILDNLKRLYLYAQKIGLLENNRPAQQPISFTLKRDIDAETVAGKRFKICIVDITQRVSLVEYTMPQ